MHQRLLVLGAIATLVMFPRPLVAQRGGGHPAATPNRPIPENPAVRTGRLPNGLTYYVLPNGYPAHRAELRLVVHAGSVLEHDDQRGLAHLLEHLAFDGSTHFPGHAMWDYLERVGMRVGADVNAVTSYDETVYRLTIPTDSAPVLGSGLQILADWAHGLTLDSAELDRERKVVIEEWRLRRGAGARIHDRQLPVLLAGSRYAGREPIGRVSTLERCTAAQLRRFYHDWYRPELMAVVIVGDVDADTVAARVRALFGSIPPSADTPARPTPTLPAHGAPRSSVVADPEATSTTVALVTERRHRAMRSEGDFRRVIAEGMYDDLIDARLDEAAHAADAPFLSARASSGRIVRPMDVHELSARVDDRGVPRALDVLRAEAARVAHGGFTTAELERERAAVLRRYDQLETQRGEIPSSQLAQTLVDEWLDGGRTPSLDAEVALARRIVPSIGLGELRRIAMERTADSSLVLLVSGPASDPAVLPTPESVAAALGRPPRALPPYVDSATAAPLLSSPPAPGRIVYALHLDSLGIDLWTLSNGVRVILEPTTFDPGQILVTSYRDGGMSAVPDSELVPAATALPLVSESGLGAFDADALRKRLSGTLAHVGGAIGAYGEGVWGQAPPKDLTTLFQLLYLEFTAPRLDSAVFRHYESQLREALAHRTASPEAAFEDTLALLLVDHSPRVRVLDTTYVRALDAAKSLAFFRSRFADATGFTFVIVGAFDRDSIRPLVARYLGGLPASGTWRRWRDTGERPPSGIAVRVVHKGKEPKAALALVFHGRAETSHRERVLLNALADVLQQRLWEELRETLGGVYGVTVTAEQEAVPVPEYRLTVRFGADPARIEALRRVVFAQISTLEADGPTALELEKFRASARRERETAARTNAFWLQAIALYDQRGWDFDGLRDNDRIADTITSAEVREAARRYLDLSRYVQVTLLPEDGS